MSCVKEEGEYIVMEASGLKAGGEEMKKFSVNFRTVWSSTQCSESSRIGGGQTAVGHPSAPPLSLMDKEGVTRILPSVALKLFEASLVWKSHREFWPSLYPPVQRLWWDRSVKMSCVKEECEDVSVMEASGLKTEDEETDRGTILREDLKEEFKLEVEPVEEKRAAQKSEQTAQHERSSGDSSQQEGHLGIHTGESFSCSQCGKSFTSERALKRHMDIHDGTRPHQCSECDLPVWRNHWSFFHAEQFGQFSVQHILPQMASLPL
ncbi:hypothetical protein SRHO_G00175950 [Serrasalmus rhombeus]